MKLPIIITGEDLTRIARDFVLEGDPEEGAEFLRKTLTSPGTENAPSWDQVYSILQGFSKLEGDSNEGVFMVPEDEDPEENEAVFGSLGSTRRYYRNSASYRADIERTYRGRVQIEGEWFRPYGQVPFFSQEDYKYSLSRTANPRTEVTGSYVREGHRSSALRAQYYAKSPESDRTILLFVVEAFAFNRWILFEKVSAPPVWFEGPKTPQEALDAWVKAGENLEVRGPTTTTSTTAPFRSRPEPREPEDLIPALRKEIQAANSEYFDLSVVRDGNDPRPTTYSIPRLPFEVWALRRTQLRGFAPKYTAIARTGVKLMNDDPFHTDWMVGATPEISYEAWYGGYGIYHSGDEPLKSAIFQAQFDLQMKLGEYEVAVLCGDGYAEGKVLHPAEDEEVPPGSIIVIPRAGPEYAIPAMSAGTTGAVITETGGELSHLALVGIESGLRLLRVPNALHCYPPETRIRVDVGRGRIHYLDEAFR